MQRAIICQDADELVDFCFREGMSPPSYTLAISDVDNNGDVHVVGIIAFREKPTLQFQLSCIEYVVGGHIYHGGPALFAPGPRDRLQRLLPLH